MRNFHNFPNKNLFLLDLLTKVLTSVTRKLKRLKQNRGYGPAGVKYRIIHCLPSVLLIASPEIIPSYGPVCI